MIFKVGLCIMLFTFHLLFKTICKIKLQLTCVCVCVYNNNNNNHHHQ